ncbi:TetR/AcrR family transcriptional regulator [Pendulispora albinea]|uniref:WHG domain-containing protein n=1 Tax=Pendulispora albinea TaxID=2741071 RepID=A0ABZ2LSY6_9BACT
MPAPSKIKKEKKAATAKAPSAARVMSRRDRVREGTLAEIHAVARKLLIEQGSAAVTINAIARAIGMSGPALYYYFGSHEELVGAVTADFYRELAETMEAARDAHRSAPAARRLMSICRAMRGWAKAHPAEFGWIFASPVTPSNRAPGSPRYRAGQRCEQVFLDEVVAIWEAKPFPVPKLEELPPSLRKQLRSYAATLEGRLPPAAVHVFLKGWIRLYGLLCMEVLHQLDFAYSDMEPIFEECLQDLSVMLALESPWK